MIIHVPHSSTHIPIEFRSDFLLSEKELEQELTLMTDHFTDELFSSALGMGATMFVNRVSRLVCDPERFSNDSDEPMTRFGMGAIYLRRQNGSLLRRMEFSTEDREVRMDNLYYPYHDSFEHLVSITLKEFGQCLIVDAHSFPEKPLAYENPYLKRPDLCIGYEAYHVPKTIVSDLNLVCSQVGIEVAENEPFAGSYVPQKYYQQDKRVQSIMLELNRQLYMDEEQCEKTGGFQNTEALLEGALKVAANSLTNQ